MNIVKRTIRGLAKRAIAYIDRDGFPIHAGFGARTVSGEVVTEASAFALSAYFACIRCIAEDVAKLPLITYKRTESGKERATGHPIYTLLHDAPNPEMSAMTFRETLTHYALGWGNGYAEIERAASGLPLALWPIHSPLIEPVRRGSVLKYEYTHPQTHQKRDIDPSNMLHIHGVGGGIAGYSVARMARESLGTAIATQKFAAAFFGNGTHMGGVLEHPGTLGPEGQANLTSSIEQMHKGAEKAIRLLVLEEGMKYTRSGLPPEDCQFLETRQFEVEEICRWFRCPPHKVQHLLRATFSNIEHQAIEYVTDTLMPWMVRWDQECSRKLLAGTDYFTEHLADALLRGDTLSRYQAYGQAIKDGWMLRSEARDRENLNTVDGLDRPLAPLNMAIVNDDGTIQVQPSGKDEATVKRELPDLTERSAAAFMPVFGAIIGRAARQEQKRLDHESKRGDGAEARVGDWIRDHAGDVAESLRPAVVGYARALCPGGMVPPDKARGLEDLSARCASAWADGWASDLRTDDVTITHYAKVCIDLVRGYFHESD